MNREYFEIKDSCRKGLLKYLEKALLRVHVNENTKVLDAGCGTGVPIIMLAQRYNCNIRAVDIDVASLNYLKEKVNILKLTDSFTIDNLSFLEIENQYKKYDLILAEGLLNVVGFTKGFSGLLKLLKSEGHIIIHDEYQDKNRKSEFIERNECKILDSFVLDQDIWWNNYYKYLERIIDSIQNEELLKYFRSDLHEINLFKKNPNLFKSVYYIIENHN